MKTLKSDLAVIGAGPGGIILALEYSHLNPNKQVILVDLKPNTLNNPLDECIQINNIVNHYSPYDLTNKGFGGTSLTWGGRCVSYDEIDFLDRDFLRKNCTWDLNYFQDIQQYFDRASFYFEAGGGKFDTNQINELKNKRIVPKFINGELMDTPIERWSMPTRFNTRYKNEILENSNITLLEGFYADTLIKNNLNEIELVILKSQDDTNERIKIESKNFVLACGAQETTRLLLKNQSIFNDNPPKSLGKFYQSHLSGKIASIKFYGNPKETVYGFEKDGEVYVRRRFQFSTDFLLNKNLLNTAFWLDNPLYFDPSHKSGAMSFMYLAMIMPWLKNKLGPPAMRYSVTKGKIYKVGKHLWNVLKDLPFSLTIPLTIFYKRYLKERKLPGIFLYNKSNIYALHFHAEQEPREENKMELENEKLVIHYELSEKDIDSIVKSHHELDAYLRKCGVGELIYWFPEQDLHKEIKAMSKDGIHQNGTTRMAMTKKLGVVDFNLKVFDTTNLFVCSSSTFPTSSQANPTFMIGAIAVKLAKYLSYKK